MPDIVHTSPLLQPVIWQGQDYFTSQYFHQEYVANSQYGGKYRRFDSFMRLLRSIPAYDDYRQTGAIVELEWMALKRDQPQLCGYLQPCFQATGYRPLTLLNGAAQAALNNFLDNEISRQMAVTTNTAIARHMAKKPHGLLPEEIAVRKLEAYLSAGRLLKAPEHIVQQEAVKQIEATTGVNWRPLLRESHAQNVIAPADKMLEPTDLAKALGMKNGAVLNRALEKIGWQVRRIGIGWEPTPAGAPYAVEHAWTSEHSTKSGYNYKWREQAVADALSNAGLLHVEEPSHA
jgi:hypothetical protein